MGPKGGGGTWSKIRLPDLSRPGKATGAAQPLEVSKGQKQADEGNCAQEETCVDFC